MINKLIKIHQDNITFTLTHRHLYSEQQFLSNIELDLHILEEFCNVDFCQWNPRISKTMNVIDSEDRGE